METKNWLTITPQGLYCVPGQFYVDPTTPVDYAIITHAHADHARSGHTKVLASPDTIAIMQVRYGDECALTYQALPYFETVYHNQVRIRLVPAGHILGSAQIILEFNNQRIVISGDYKRQLDPTCEPFHVEQADVFITEATFGLPVFVHPPIEVEVNKLIVSLKNNSERCHLVGAYVLGKCQRVITTLRLLGYNDTIYLHGSQIKMCEFYQQQGIDLGSLANASELNSTSARGKIVICPPSALRDRWSRRLGELVIAFASGWMQIRARAKQQGVELPLIISDHADWPELTQTIREVNAQEVWVTHGREEALVYYAQRQGFKAKALNLLGYEEDEG